MPPCLYNRLSYECQTLTNCCHHYHFQNPKYCHLHNRFRCQGISNGRMPNWVEFTRGLSEHRQICYQWGYPIQSYIKQTKTVQIQPESQPRPHPGISSDRPSRRPQAGGQPISCDRKVTQGKCLNLWTHTRRVGQEILKYSDQLNECIIKGNITYCTNEY